MLGRFVTRNRCGMPGTGGRSCYYNYCTKDWQIQDKTIIVGPKYG